MADIDVEQLANLKGIGMLYGVSTAAVANWRDRHDDFPQQIRTPWVDGIPLYDLTEVVAWCVAHGRHMPRLGRRNG